VDGEGKCEEARPRLAVGGYELRKGKGEHPCKVDAFPTGSCQDRKSRPNVTRSFYLLLTKHRPCGKIVKSDSISAINGMPYQKRLAVLSSAEESLTSGK